jgi:6-O-methylguanine DNA methyltransferase, DNA binding domain
MSSTKTKKKSWREKLADSKDLPKVAEIDCTKTKHWGEGTFVIPAPLEVDAAMKKVHRGKLTTIDAIRTALAKKHGTTIACPMTTGIFAWIAAHAADEGETSGRSRVTPYWRTLKAGGELNPKYPGGVKNLRARLAAEGHRVVKKGNRYFVAGFEQSLVQPAI